MAQPKQATSRSKTRTRRHSIKVEAITIIPCEKCGSAKLPHHICLVCGTYKGVRYLDVEKKDRKKEAKKREAEKAQLERQKPPERDEKLQKPSTQKTASKKLIQRTTSK